MGVRIRMATAGIAGVTGFTADDLTEANNNAVLSVNTAYVFRSGSTPGNYTISLPPPNLSTNGNVLKFKNLLAVPVDLTILAATADAFTADNTAGTITAGSGTPFSSLTTGTDYTISRGSTSGVYTVTSDTVLTRVSGSTPSQIVATSTSDLTFIEDTSETYTVTIDRNGSLIDGRVTNITSNTLNEIFELVYFGGTLGWVAI